MSSAVKTVAVPDDRNGQRLDNFLTLELKGLPRSVIYKLIRTGQVRVNGGRSKPQRKLISGDQVRIPPVRRQEQVRPGIPEAQIAALRQRVIYQDPNIMVLDKPAGLAVHAGSGLPYGLIDIARAAWPDSRLELVHRLDRDTSGCLVLSRNRQTLLSLQDQFRSRQVSKSYLCLLMGRLPEPLMEIDIPLSRPQEKGGERIVVADPQGKPALSRFRVLEQFSTSDYVEVELITGRTHQIRVHARELGHPLAGDEKYGDREFNKRLNRRGLKRLFLHAHRLELPEINDGSLLLDAPLPPDLRQLLDRLSGRK